jgi:hypothetical protein
MPYTEKIKQPTFVYAIQTKHLITNKNIKL